MHKNYLHLLTRYPLVKGIRRLIQSENNPSFCLSNNFINNVKQLAEFNLSFDLCIQPHQFPAILSLVSACPEVQFILNHAGKPVISHSPSTTWKNNLTYLAKYPNVACKLSGLLTEANLQDSKPKNCASYILHIMDVFGPDRVMYGSDWPVLTLVAEYRYWLTLLYETIKHFPEHLIQKIFFYNAQRIYRLNNLTYMEK